MGLMLVCQQGKTLDVGITWKPFGGQRIVQTIFFDELISQFPKFFVLHMVPIHIRRIDQTCLKITLPGNGRVATPQYMSVPEVTVNRGIVLRRENAGLKRFNGNVIFAGLHINITHGNIVGKIRCIIQIATIDCVEHLLEKRIFDF